MFQLEDESCFHAGMVIVTLLRRSPARVGWRGCVRRLKSTNSGGAGGEAGRAISELTVGVPREIFEKETRVAVTPSSVQALVKAGFNVRVEEKAGLGARFADVDYVSAGAQVGQSDNQNHSKRNVHK